MKELTLAEAIEALKKGKKVRLNKKKTTPFCLKENGKFRFDGYSGDNLFIHLEESGLCDSISDFEDILNGKRFVLVEDTKPILDDKEKEYLRNIIKPFKKEYKATTITKVMIWGRTCYIDIELLRKGHEDDCHEDIKLPYFSADDMYKGMEIDKEYTLEELGL